MTRKICILSMVFITAGLVISACSGQSPSAQQTTPVQGEAANGEEIYFTGIDQNGNHIRYTGGPNFGGMMMGSYLTCASCHGPDAHGGLHVMHMQVMDAPPIYYDALVEMKAEDTGTTPQPGGYTLEDFRKEVVDGKDVGGETLDTDMPRWQMSDQDLAAIFAFLKTITE